MVYSILEILFAIHGAFYLLTLHMVEVEQVLSELGLLQYLNRFLDEGFDTWETVLDVTEEDLWDTSNLPLPIGTTIDSRLVMPWG